MIALIIAAFILVAYAFNAIGSSIGSKTSSSATPVPTPAPSQQPTAVQPPTQYASDQSLTGGPITSDPASWPGSDTDKVWNICAAVAIAEGYNKGVGAAPYDLNNPGDLSPGDEYSQSVCGQAQFHGGSYIINFCTAENGFKALYVKFNNIVNGRSKVYPASWTWQQVASKYAGDSASWLANVTDYLGVDPTSTPRDYVNS